MTKYFDIKLFLKNKNIPALDSEIVSSLNLSSAYGSVCEKITLKNGKIFVIKVQVTKDNNNYTSAYYEGKSLVDMHKKFGSIFPKIYHLEKNFFVMNWINHYIFKNDNSKINNFSEKDFAKKLSKIHSVKNECYGYDFNTPIGGLEQPCLFEKNWVNFFKNKRLLMIFEKINQSNSLPNYINKGIEKIIKNLDNYIIDFNSPSLIHGDLWSGNILANNDGNIVGLIDPSIHYADNEYELSYLLFLNTVSDNFFNYYKDYHNIEKGFKERSDIYQIYHALVNVYLWDRVYINYVAEKLKKFN